MNPFQTLGIGVDATEEEIQHAFRTLSKIYHPDAGGDPELFKRIMDAYNLLRDKDNLECLREEFRSTTGQGTAYQRNDERKPQMKMAEQSIPSNKTSTNTIGYFIIFSVVIFISFAIYILIFNKDTEVELDLERELEILHNEYEQLEQSSTILLQDYENAKSELDAIKEAERVRDLTATEKDLVVENLTFRNEHVYGEILNPTENYFKATTSSVSFTISFLNANGEIIASAEHLVYPLSLGPGESKVFQEWVYPAPGKYAKIKATIN
jgi:cell division protein FtsB